MPSWCILCSQNSALAISILGEAQQPAEVNLVLVVVESYYDLSK